MVKEIQFNTKYHTTRIQHEEKNESKAISYNKKFIQHKKYNIWWEFLAQF